VLKTKKSKEPELRSAQASSTPFNKSPTV